MKPISLTVSGIGPYATKMPTLYFDELCTEGLFLITGPTGSGKTTIFDCVSFALFGVSSGEYRDSKNIKSEFAEDGTECYVEFEFYHQGNRYIVYRNPAYRGKGKKGLANISENAVLYKGIDISVDKEERGNYVVCEGNSNVNDAIKDLLNIDKNQFKQVSMIAQGEFWKLLNASSDDRTKILRKIFLTSPILKMGDILKSKKDASYQKIDSLKNTMISLLSDCQADEESEYSERLETLKQNAFSTKSVWNMDEISDLFASLIEEDEKRIEEWNALVSQVQKESYEKNSELALAQGHNRAIENRDKLRQRKDELDAKKGDIAELEIRVKRQKSATYIVYPVYSAKKEKRDAVNEQKISIEKSESNKIIADEWLVKANERLAECTPNKDKADKLSNDSILLKKEEELYAERDAIVASLSKLKSKKESLINKSKDNRLSEENIKKQIAELTLLEKELKEAISNKAQIEVSLNRTTTLLSDISVLLDKTIPDYEQKYAAYESLKSEFEKAMLEYEKARDTYNKAKDQADLNKAGILRKTLTEGKPCPVCGEIFHEANGGLACFALTKDGVERIDDARLEELNTLFVSAEENKNALFEKVSTAKATSESTLEIVLEKCNEIISRVEEVAESENAGDVVVVDSDNSSGELLALKQRIFAANAVISTINAKQDAEYKKIIEDSQRLEEISATIVTLRDEELAKIASEKESISEEEKNVSEEIAKLDGKLTAIGKLKFNSEEEAVLARKKLEKEASDILDEIEKAKTEKENASKKVAILVTEIDTKRQAFEKLQKEADLLDIQFRDSLAENGFSSEEIYFTFVSSEDKISDSENLINTYKQEEKSVTDQLTELEKETAGKQIVDLEALQNMVGELKEKVEALSSKKNSIVNRYDSNKQRKKRFDDAGPDFGLAQREFSTYGTLYNLVIGADDGTKKGKLTLEQFVQASGFDGIIRAANKRLVPMSDGRYELRRKDFSGSKKKGANSLGSQTNTAFDLVVMDNYTGITRPVGDLSGGESFIASLSLALGLSDTVSMQRGGLQMDALFIDEGFGTLDSDLIDTVMKVLTDLSQANKMVGIISHREELMQNIHQQIVVEKGRTGSTFSVVSTD